MTRYSPFICAAIAAWWLPTTSPAARAAEIRFDMTGIAVHKGRSDAADQLANELDDALPGNVALGVAELQDGNQATRMAAESLALALESRGRRVALARVADPTPGSWMHIRVATRTLENRHQIEVFCGDKRYAAFHHGKDWIDGHGGERDPDCCWFQVRSDWKFEPGQAARQAKQQLAQEIRQELDPTRPADGPPSMERISCLLTDTRIRSDEYVEKKVRPYGTQYRHHLLIGIPQPLLKERKAAVVWDLWARRARLVLSTVLVSLSLAASMWAAYRLDRLTRGYRRVHLAAGLFGVFSLLTWLWRIIVL